MKKLYISAIVLLLMTSVVAQADAYYLYNIYPSSYTNNNDNRPDKIKQKIKIKIKGDNNSIIAKQNAYQYPQLVSAPQPTPVPQPNLIPYYYNYYYYNYNPQPQPYPQPQPQPYPQNRQPVWNQSPMQIVNVGQQLQFYVSAVDPDNDYLNYSANNLPSEATFNPYSRMFVWSPSAYQIGSYSVNFRVTDNTTSPVDMYISITVYANQWCSGYNCGSTPTPVPVPNQNSCYNQIYFTSQMPSVNAREGQLFTYAVQAASYGCPVTYRLVSGPTGLSFNQYSGVITWTPSYNQGGQAYAISVAASNSYYEATQTFYVYVEDGNTIYSPIYESPVYTQPVQAIEKLKISSVTIQTDSNSDVWVSWETNKPSTSRIIFDVFSEVNKTKDFTYDFATPDDVDLVTTHQVNLGQLEPNKTFYLRAVSKKGAEMAFSNELTFVKLPSAGVASSVWNILGDFFSGQGLFWVLLLIIILLGVALMRSYRRPATASRLQ